MDNNYYFCLVKLKNHGHEKRKTNLQDPEGNP